MDGRILLQRLQGTGRPQELDRRRRVSRQDSSRTADPRFVVTGRQCHHRRRIVTPREERVAKINQQQKRISIQTCFPFMAACFLLESLLG